MSSFSKVHIFTASWVFILCDTLIYIFESLFLTSCSDSVGGIVAGSIALVIILVVVSVVVRAKHRQSVVTPISSGGAHISTVNTNINTNIHGGYSLILFILEIENIQSCFHVRLFDCKNVMAYWQYFINGYAYFVLNKRLGGFDRSDLMKIS